MHVKQDRKSQDSRVYRLAQAGLRMVYSAILKLSTLLTLQLSRTDIAVRQSPSITSLTSESKQTQLREMCVLAGGMQGDGRQAP